MLGKVDARPRRSDCSQLLNLVSDLTADEELMEAARVYLEAVEGRRLRDALDSSGFTWILIYPGVSGSCDVLFLHSTRSLLGVYHGSIHAIHDVV